MPFAVPNAPLSRGNRVYPHPLVPHRADPQVHRHTDGFYDFTATHPDCGRIVLRRSRTPAGLAAVPESVVRRAHPAGDMGAHSWAPEFHRVGDAWYVHFAAAPAEDEWTIRVRVLENTDSGPLQEIDGDPPDDPNRHTRIQTVGRNPDGTPDFGVPLADTVKEST
jgi:GH43 family beta-xylosidase